MAGPWEMFQQQPQQPSQALPQPGDPTEYAAPGQAAQTTPSYMGPEDFQALGLEMLAGRGSASVINQSPGKQQQLHYAQKTGENLAALRNTQRAIEPLLDRIDDFAKVGVKAGPDILKKATGPNYGGDSGIASWVLPDTSGESYQAVRAIAQTANPFGPQFLDTSGHGPYDVARNANLEMHHLKDAIGSAFKAIPGGGKNGSTDQAQALVLDMVGKALHASDPETFFKILHDAKNTLRGVGGLPAMPDKESYLPDEWRKPSPPAGATNASAPGQSGSNMLAGLSAGAAPVASRQPASFDKVPDIPVGSRIKDTQTGKIYEKRGNRLFEVK